MPYCYRCGTQLSEEDNTCSNCGAPAAKIITSSTTPPAPRKNTLLKILLPAGILLIALAVAAILFLPRLLPSEGSTSAVTSPSESTAGETTPSESTPSESTAGTNLENPLDFNHIADLYGLRMGLTAEEISPLLDFEHIVLPGKNNPVGLEESEIFADDNAQITFLGVKAADILFSFKGLVLDGIYISFNNEDISFEKLVQRVCACYGEPEAETDTGCMWRGVSLTLLATQDEDGKILLVYSTTGTRLGKLEFNGAGIDPAGFLGENTPIGQNISVYLEGLTEGYDYFHYSHTEGEEYDMIPFFSYLGADMLGQRVKMYPNADGIIERVSYRFSVDEAAAQQKAKTVFSMINQLYGPPGMCGDSEKEFSADVFMSHLDKGLEDNHYSFWAVEDRMLSLGLFPDSNGTGYDIEVLIA